MTCKDTPDSGSSAGIESHTYDGVSKRYLTSYTFKCPFGKYKSFLAFHTIQTLF